MTPMITESLVLPSPAPATGTNYVRVILPPEGALVAAYARNATRGWGVVELRIGGISSPIEDPAGVILKRESQGAASVGVPWTGQLDLGPSLRVLVATFLDCQIGDSLVVSAGVSK